MNAMEILKIATRNKVAIPTEIMTSMQTSNSKSINSVVEQQQQRCDAFNSTSGNLHLSDGICCDKCNNKGYLNVLSGTEIISRDCECMNARKSINRIKQSGIANQIALMKFDSFKATEKWQIGIKDTAVDFVASYKYNWFYIGGQPGCGKTHLCTAIVGELITKHQIDTRYYIWGDIVNKLKSLKLNNYPEYEKELSEIVKIDALYIDDFLKVPKRDDKATSPTDSDLSIAFDIINKRYINDKSITIISGEYNIAEIAKRFDNALASRIFERCLGSKYTLFINRDDDKNYRFNQVKHNGK